MTYYFRSIKTIYDKTNQSYIQANGLKLNKQNNSIWPLFKNGFYRMWGIHYIHIQTFPNPQVRMSWPVGLRRVLEYSDIFEFRLKIEYSYSWLSRSLNRDLLFFIINMMTICARHNDAPLTHGPHHTNTILWCVMCKLAVWHTFYAYNASFVSNNW